MSKNTEVLERLAALEAVVGIGHNGGPPLDDDEPPKHKPGLLPDKQVAQRYGVSVRSLERWDKISDLNFPPPIYIRRRRYRNIAKLDQFDKDNAREVADPPNPHRDCAQALPRAQRGRFTKPVENSLNSRPPSRAADEVSEEAGMRGRIKPTGTGVCAMPSLKQRSRGGPA